MLLKGVIRCMHIEWGIVDGLDDQALTLVTLSIYTYFVIYNVASNLLIEFLLDGLLNLVQKVVKF